MIGYAARRRAVAAGGARGAQAPRRRRRRARPHAGAPRARCALPLLQALRVARATQPRRRRPRVPAPLAVGLRRRDLLPGGARAAAGTSARTLAPRAAAALLAAVAAGAEPPAGLAAPAEGAPAARLLLLDLREPAAIAAAADAPERTTPRAVQGRAQMRHRVPREGGRLPDPPRRAVPGGALMLRYTLPFY